MAKNTLSKWFNVGTLKNAAKLYPQWAICVVLILVMSFYWGIWASNRYVSHAHVVISMPQISTAQGNFTSEDSSVSREMAASLLLRDYIQSADMLSYLEKNTDIREHFSENGDFFSRLRDKNAPTEKLLKYYQGIVSAEPDEYSGVMHVDVQAYTSEEAHKLATEILAQGQRHMNRMTQRVAQQQVSFLEKQSHLLQEQYQQAQQASLKFQNEHNLPEPTQTLQNFGSIVGQLQSQLASLKARRASLAAFQSPRSAEMMSVNNQIDATQRQIDSEQRKLASQSGNPLNSVAAEFQVLQLRTQFALQAYSGVLTALQNARVASVNQTVQVSYLQQPTLPQYSEAPARIYNTAVFAMIALFVTLIVNMLILIVKDHKD
ncbi:chain-length determining protein [Carnimonas bestiolae]|uniref:chain-length determining protein n=1 Tax=Carnimonas bestiolae TaxID=3402172 RepID=UPI003EDBC462